VRGPGNEKPGEPIEGLRPGTLSALLQDLVRCPEDERSGAWDRVLRPGLVIDRYELVREIGRGGFGVVWEARDRGLGREVALKAVRAGQRPDLREERLLREAEAAARLAHPNIVSLLDAGRSEQGPYLVLELLRGETLAIRLDQGPLAVREALRIGIEVAKGLAHAHEQGVVHRDLTPGNVFLCRDGQVKVLDFGMAHAFGRPKAEGGTRSYMAPEQAAGAPEDERTDVFALGVVLYRMLSGRLPYPYSPSKRARRAAPRQLEVEELPALGTFLARMTSTEPLKRPRNCAEVLAALTTFQHELEGSPSSGTSGVHLRRRVRTRQATVVITGLLLALAVAVGVASRRARPPASRTDGRILVAVGDVVNETGEPELGVLSGLLVTSLEQSSRLSVMTRSRVLDLAARAGVKTALGFDETVGREIGRTQGVAVLLLPAVHRLGTVYSVEVRGIDPRRGERLFTFSDRASAKEALLPALDNLSEQVRGALREDHLDVVGSSIRLADATTASLEAYQHYTSGLEAWMRDGLRGTALREFLEALRLDPRFGAAHERVAFLYDVFGRPDLAAPHRKAAIENIGRMPEKERLLLLLYLSGDQSVPGRFSKEGGFRLANQLVQRFPDDKSVLSRVGLAYWVFEERERATVLFRKALELDPAFNHALSGLSNGLLEAAESLSVARRAVATRRSPANLNFLGVALLANGAQPEAVDAVREALRLDGGQSSFILANACHLLYTAGLASDCLTAARRAAVNGVTDLDREEARKLVVMILAARGQMREARRVLEATDLRKTLDGGLQAWILSIGRSRCDAPEALAKARRIEDPFARRYWLAFFCAPEEAERTPTVSPRNGFESEENLYRLHALSARRAWDEALDLVPVVEHTLYLDDDQWRLFAVTLLKAEALLESGRPEQAAAAEAVKLRGRHIFMLDHGANYPRLALVRARAMERLGRSADAIRELDGLLAFWKDADDDLPLLVEARASRSRLAAAAQLRLESGPAH
jgi:eukaryotic-like serine/threonine-protein kinase